MRAPIQRSGFTLIELLVALTLGALLIGLTLPMLGSSRCAARDAFSQANLKRIGVASDGFANDSNNAVFNFNWQTSTLYTLANGVQVVSNDQIRVHQWQQLDLLLRFSNRIGGNDELVLNTRTVPYRRFRFLMLLDYLSAKLPEPVVASPHDQNLIRWQADPTNVGPGIVPTNPPSPSAGNSFGRPEVYEKWPYASSYITTTYSWSGERGPRVLPSSGPYLLSLPNGSVQQRTFDEVAFPGQKVMEFEEYDWCKKQYWAYDDSTVPQLFFDGSVQFNATSDANLGWDANRPSDVNRFYAVNFYPIDPDFFPPARFDTNGDDIDDVAVAGRYLWTRGGLEGVDYGGDEIDTSDF